MSKYIDADLLRNDIEFAKSVYSNPKRVVHGMADAFRQDGRAAMCDDILKKIDSLPEQPVEGLEEEMFKEWGTTKEEYLAKSMDKVHLEMEIATYLQDWENDDEIGLHLSTDEGCMPIELEDIRDLARHFAEWGAEHAKK